MKNNTKKTLCIFLALLSVNFALTGCGDGDTSESAATTAVVETTESIVEKEPETATVSVRNISKHGNVVLDTTFDEMKEMNMEVGDIITVYVGDESYDLPIGNSFTDVDNGSMICRFDTEDNEVAIAINMGSFADEAGIGVKQEIEEEPGYKWDISVKEVRLSLKEKAGYLDEYNARNLTRTDNREDYAALSDEDFANFREIKTTGIKEGTLFRSSTPVEPAIGRNEYAMAAMEKAGVKSVINLDDTVELMKSYETYEGSYYSECNILNSEMNYDFGSEEFAARVNECVKFIVDNDGPYLIHCKEGKDRTGILCAILECYMGGTIEEIVEDYMATYYNYYGVEAGQATYDIILKNNLISTFAGLYNSENPLTLNLKDEAEKYLLSTGLTAEDLSALTAKLGN